MFTTLTFVCSQKAMRSKRARKYSLIIWNLRTQGQVHFHNLRQTGATMSSCLGAFARLFKKRFVEDYCFVFHWSHGTELKKKTSTETYLSVRRGFSSVTPHSAGLQLFCVAESWKFSARTVMGALKKLFSKAVTTVFFLVAFLYE